MWTYNNLYEDTLYHHGIKGQKWGIRRYQNEDGSLTAAGRKRLARQELSDAKRNEKVVKRERPRGLGVGMEGIKKYKDYLKKIDEAEMNTLRSRIKYNKERNQKNSDIAEFNTYVKEIKKTGLPGSIGDSKSRDRSTRIYNEMIKKKGQDYANGVLVKAENQLAKEFAISELVGIGAAAVTGYMVIKYN